MSDAAIHPFMSWCAGLLKLEAGKIEGTDLILSDLGSKRFGLGVHNTSPILYWLESDKLVMESIKWTSAALAFGLNNRDWIALSAQDIRIKDSEAFNPMRMRLFIPVAAGRLDAWKSVSPKSLFMSLMKIEKGIPTFVGTPPKELILKLTAK